MKSVGARKISARTGHGRPHQLVRSGRSGRGHRGVTLLEVVLATALLALLAASLASTVGFANRSEVLRYKRLAAYEVANERLLRHIDQEFNTNLDPAQPVAYEGLRFSYDIFMERTTVEQPGEVKSNNNFAEGLRLVRIRVYELAAPYPGATEVRGPLLAELVRPNHMLMATFRNPDAMQRNVLDPKWLGNLKGLSPGTGGDR